MSATSQGAFVVIPEISHSDISYIIKKIPKVLLFLELSGFFAFLCQQI